VPPPQWESYFWPSTQVWKNKFGIKDEATLTAMERLHTTLQAERIASGLIPIDRTFDAAHLKAIHAALFSRIYTWAGEFRTVNMRRGVNEFASVADIPRVVDEMHGQISETDWSIEDRDVFASNISTTAAIGNFAHPFRDGNGRMMRILLNHVCERSPYRLDFTDLDAAVWNQRSALTMPDRGGTQVHPEEFVDVFKAITVDAGRHIEVERGEDGFGLESDHDSGGDLSL
jgi:cell filamentation protein